MSINTPSEPCVTESDFMEKVFRYRPAAPPRLWTGSLTCRYREQKLRPFLFPLFGQTLVWKWRETDDVLILYDRCYDS